MKRALAIAAPLAMACLLDVPEIFRPAKRYRRSLACKYQTKEANDEELRAAQLKRDRKAAKRLNSLPAKQ